MAKSITKNSIFNLIYNILNVLFPFVISIYISHILFPSNIGEIEAAKNISQYFVILAFLGIPTYGLREIARARGDKDKLNKVYSELMVINTISTTFFLAVYFGVIFAVPAYRENILLYLIFGGSVAFNFLNNSWLYEGLEEYSYICYRNLIIKILSFVALLLLVRGDGDYAIYAIIIVLGSGLNYVFNILHARKFVHFTLKDLNLKRHLKPIMFLVAVNLAIEVYTLVDVTMLKFLSTSENVAYYSYGSRIYKILLQAIYSFTIVIVPRIAYYFKNNQKAELNSLLSKTLIVVFVTALPIIIGSLFVADYIIVNLYGESYISSAQVFKILSVILLIAPTGFLLGSRVLLITGKEKLMVIPVFSGMIVNVVLNYFLIKKYDHYGAALASLISETVVMTVYILLAHKYFKLTKFVPSLVKVVISATLMFGVLMLLSQGNFSGYLMLTIKEIIVGASIYILSLLVLQENVTKDLLFKIKRVLIG